MRVVICALCCVAFFGCHTSSQVDLWSDAASSALLADQVNLQGFSEELRILDVVLVTRATHVPMLNREACVDVLDEAEKLRTVKVRHRFRTKPGKISIVVPTLPSSLASSACRPELHSIKVVEVSSTGVPKRILASIPAPMAATYRLDFQQKPSAP